jgi:hypothetical protein
MSIIFHQDSEPEEAVYAVIDDPRYRWIGKMRVGIPINGGTSYFCRSHHPVRDNNLHLDLMIPAHWLDEITDTTIDDIIIEWNSYHGRN